MATGVMLDQRVQPQTLSYLSNPVLGSGVVLFVEIDARSRYTHLINVLIINIYSVAGIKPVVKSPNIPLSANLL